MTLEIETAQGRLRGSLRGGVRAWLGIPYAAPPVGALRWRPPQPAVPWRGVREATAFGADLPQPPLPASRAPAQSEDALLLNIWSPPDAAPGSLPVMLWFHGGGFVGGSGADARSDGARLAAQGVVVVSFNYRAGLFGFFAHPALTAESQALHDGGGGNHGLKDQLAALRWVHQHIAAFGGDAARITAFGVSAGSASIALLLTVPAAAGLFRQAILHSPGCGRPLASLEQAEAAGARLGAELGLDLAGLRDLDADRLLALTTKLNPSVRGLTTPRVLRPVHDGVLVREDERAAWAGGRLRPTPLVVGTNADEGTLLTRGWPLATPADHEALIRANFAGAEAAALTWYPRVQEAFADTQFNFGARELLRAMRRIEPRCWRYRFTRRRPGAVDGPHHGDEVGYAFGQPEQGRSGIEPVDEADRRASDAMLHAWASFARDGEPGLPAGLSAALADEPSDGPVWPRFAAGDERHLDFGDAPALAHDPLAGRLDFLQRYYAQA